jgi:hypothetical protein
MSVTWCTWPGGNSAHYFTDGMDRPCECGQRPWFLAHAGRPRPDPPAQAPPSQAPCTQDP